MQGRPAWTLPILELALQPVNAPLFLAKLYYLTHQWPVPTPSQLKRYEGEGAATRTEAAQRREFMLEVSRCLTGEEPRNLYLPDDKAAVPQVPDVGW